MKNILVTGGAGMVGYQLVKQLKQRGYNVRVIDNFSRGQNKMDGVEYITDDVGDLTTCKQAMMGCDTVFNLAAEVAGVGFNQKNHALMFEKNIKTLSVPLEAAVKTKVQRFLQVSSVCIYADECLNPATEECGWSGEPTGANIGYSIAKRMGERLALWYRQEYGLQTIIVRPSNVFGLYDYFDEKAHVIPRLIKQVVSDKPYVNVRGNGKTFREFIYSEDVAKGMIYLIECGESGEIYNLGTNGRTKINTRELLSMIEFILGCKKERRYIDDEQTGDSDRWSDCTKVESLGWRAETSLIDGLKQVIDWYLTTLTI